MVKPGDRKNMATYLTENHSVSLTRACKVVCLPKSMYYYDSIKNDSQVIAKLLELAAQKPSEGQDKFYARIRNEGLSWNYKRVRRVYSLLKLNKRRRHKRRVPVRIKQPLQQPEGPNRSWSMDFTTDVLMNKRKFRTLNILDDFNRKAVHIEVDYSFAGTTVITTLQKQFMK